ncbi:hypothetical protein CRUP_013736, partial [Coryphaenoides rupestris]
MPRSYIHPYTASSRRKPNLVVVVVVVVQLNMEHQVVFEKQWDGLKQYFGVNDRFQPPASSNPPPQSGLEKSMESAIAEGDIGRAEEMSDRLATRE